MMETAHVGLVVSNLETSVNFYRDLLGCVLTRRMEREGEDISRIVGVAGAHLKIASLELPGANGLSIELIEYVSPKGRLVDTTVYNPGNAHICFKTDDIHGTWTLLRSRGVKFKNAPVDILNGANRGGKACYFEDPDGVSLELIQRST